jgi:hypothetical protein
MLQEEAPWMVGMMVLEASPFLPCLVFPSRPLLSYVNQPIALLAILKPVSESSYFVAS